MLAALLALFLSPGLAGTLAAPVEAPRAPASAVRPELPAPAPSFLALPSLEAPARAARPEALGTLRESVGRLEQLARPASRPEPAPAAVSAELGRLYENAAAAGVPADPPASAPAPHTGRASGLAPPRLRPLESIQRLKVATYNVENLFHQVGSHIPDPARPGHLKKVSAAKPKPDWALAEQAKIILGEGLDVLVLQEVEDIGALEDFNDRFLGGAYRPLLMEGNDPRGIDVAFLVKKDIPFELEQRTHKDETWQDPVFGGERTLFSRDLTSLIFRAPGRAEPLFVLFGTHYKSKRDRDPRDPESNVLRAAQVERTAEILERYRREFGARVPLMLAGDFNGTVPEDAAFTPLFEKAGLTDAFDASPAPPSDRDRITHTYHPRGGPAHYAQMDALLVSGDLRGTVAAASVYRYRNADGTPRPIPKTYEEREKNPSDHFPVLVELDFQPILEGKFPDWRPSRKPASRPGDGNPLPPPPAAPSPEEAARAFADSLRSWSEGRAASLEAKLADWRSWAADPSAWVLARRGKGYVSRYTQGNLPEIRRRLDRLARAHEAFLSEADAVPRGPVTPALVHRLYQAWDELRGAVNAFSIVLEDSYAEDAARRGLIANTDQNMGHQPGGLDVLRSPVRDADWDAARVLNGHYADNPVAPSLGAALRDFIWEKRILPSAYKILPETRSGWRSAFKALRAFFTPGRTFEHEGDELPPSRGGYKLFHPFGSTLKVQYRARPGHPFGGMLAEADAPGLMRLSLAAPQKGGSFIPGVALKLFRDGRESVNAELLGAGTGVDGQQPNHDFFAQPFTNALPKPKTLKMKIATLLIRLLFRRDANYLPVGRLGAVAPYRIVLVPVAGRSTPKDSSRDFREHLAELDPGPLFEVWASASADGTLIRVGDIEATSAPVASEYGDKELFFRH